jgi:hypothetical protein
MENFDGLKAFRKSQWSDENSHFLYTPLTWILWFHTVMVSVFHILFSLLPYFSFPPRNAFGEGQNWIYRLFTVKSRKFDTVKRGVWGGWSVTSVQYMLWYSISHWIPFLLILLQRSKIENNMIKWEIQRRPIHECWCDERLKAKVEGSTRLTYTGLSFSWKIPTVTTPGTR